MIELASDALGLDAQELAVGQMALRAVIVFVVALAYVRIGDKRLLGKGTAFDVVVAIMFGSVMSRAITTSEAFLPVVVAGGVLVFLHWLFAVLTFRSDRIGALVKGHERNLVVDGKIQWDQMAAAHVTERDLLRGLRERGGVEDVSDVDAARLERSGDISVVPRSRGPRVVDVPVDDGVQTVRIELEG
jgi:uncharacterized membrane protein YcaP (DUF421 family)